MPDLIRQLLENVNFNFTQTNETLSFLACSFWKPTLPAVFRAAFQETGSLLPQLFQEGEEWRQGWAQRPHPLQPDPGGGQGMMVFMPTC